VSARFGGFADLCGRLEEARRTRRVSIVALVGAGGKTSSMFALARFFASPVRAVALRVLVTTTTRIHDPTSRSEREGRGFGTLLLLPDPASPSSLERIGLAGPRVVLASGRSDDGAKLMGVDPASMAAVAPLFDAVLLEADGARGLSVKAPSPTEPVIPSSCTAVVGLVGLDALGAPMDARVVHRPQLFGPLVGCAPGEPVSTTHILRLASSPRGLFQGAPPGALRFLLLNKADAVPRDTAAECAERIAASKVCDAVFTAAVGKGDRS